MLDLRILREHLEQVESAYLKRGHRTELAPPAQREAARGRLQRKLEALKKQRNQPSETTARLKRAGESPGEVDRLRAETQQLGETMKTLEAAWQAVDAEVEAALLALPNLPHNSVPQGRDASANVEVRRAGSPRRVAFDPKPHWELGERLGILDFERAARMTGSRFAVYRGAGARLERALINFMLDRHTGEHGYTEILPPALVNRASLIGTGQLPKFEEDLFRLAAEDYFLIPTAEVPLTNLHRDEILAEADLPLAYTACTPCFRREAGSYGKDVRGLVRPGGGGPDRAAPVQKGRTDDVHPARGLLRRAGAPDAPRRVDPRRAGAAVPGRRALRRRPGVRLGQDVRPRGLAARRERVPGNLVVQQLRGVSGAPDRDSLSGGRRPEDGVRPHAQRLRSGRGADGRSEPGKRSRGRRVGHDPEGDPTAHGRDGLQ